MSGRALSLARLPLRGTGSGHVSMAWRAGEALLVAGVVALSIDLLASDEAVIAALVCAALVVLSAADVRGGVLPERAFAASIAGVMLAQLILFPGRALTNGLVALGICVVLALPALAGRSWLELRDAKLALLVGLGIGWGVLGALLLAFACTLPLAVVLIIRRGLAARNTTVPFGPFLTFGTLVVLFGPTLAGLS